MQPHIRSARADRFAHSDFLRALRHGDKHDVHHADSADQQPDRADDRGENHQRSRQLIPQIAQEVRRVQFEIIFCTRGDAAQPAHRLNDFTLGRFDVGVLRNRKRHEQLLGFRILLFEIAERDDHEDIHAGAEEQSLVVLENADDLVDAPVDAHGFPHRVRVREKRFADCCAQHHHRTRVLFVKRADEAAALDGEQRNCLRILRLSPADHNFFDAAISAGDPVGVPKEETARAKCRHDMHVGSGLPDSFGVMVFKILARANPLRQAGRVRAKRNPGDEISARAQAFYAVLHKLVQPLNDGGHRDHRRNADDDAEHRQGRAHLRRAQRFHGGEEILAGLCQRHDGHQSDLRATTGSSRDARIAG